MAASSVSPLSDVPVVKTKLRLLPLLLVAVGTGILASSVTGAAGYLLIHSGRLALSPGDKQAPPSRSLAPTPTHAVVLEPIVANLADAGGTAYLRLGLTLRVIDDAAAPAPKAKGEKAVKGADDGQDTLRDTVLQVIGTETSEALSGGRGKEELKRQLHLGFSERNPTIKVADLYITEFLVQR